MHRCNACGGTYPVKAWQQTGLKCPNCLTPDAPAASTGVSSGNESVVCSACRVPAPARTWQAQGGRCPTCLTKPASAGAQPAMVVCPACRHTTPSAHGACGVCGTRLGGPPSSAGQAAATSRQCVACKLVSPVAVWNQTGMCPGCGSRANPPKSSKAIVGSDTPMTTCTACGQPTPAVGQCLSCGTSRTPVSPDYITCSSCHHTATVGAWKFGNGSCPLCQRATPIIPESMRQAAAGSAPVYRRPEVVECEGCGELIATDDEDFVRCSMCTTVTMLD